MFNIGDKVIRWDCYRYFTYGPVRTVVKADKGFYLLDNGLQIHESSLKPFQKQKLKINLNLLEKE